MYIILYIYYLFIYDIELHNKLEKDYPVVFRLSEEGGAHAYGDVVIDATGVEPNVDFLATDELVRGLIFNIVF